jgi:amidase
MTDLAFRPAVELAALLRRRELSCRELLEHYVARVERLNPRINAVVTLDLERARARADAADQVLARGDAPGPLHGLPMTIKDSFETAGLRTTSGAPALANHVPAADATAVARLVAAGAVVFGKTNLPVYAMDVQSYNPLFGTTVNPWDATRSPGGSSGGAAAAVATGLTALELGSDIGGSIRNPSHYCGVYGHKPTFGIVPQRGHIPGAPGNLTGADINVVGPIARSADDLEHALDVLAGPDESAAVAWRLTLPPPRRTRVADYRVAAWLDDADCPTDTPVRARLEAAVDALGRAGVTVDRTARPAFALGDAYEEYVSLLAAATSPGLPAPAFDAQAALATGLDPTDASLLAQFVRGTVQRHRDWLGANERRARYRAQWADFFRSYDALLCPITPVAAIPHDHEGEVIQRSITVNGGARPYADQLVWAGVIGMAYLPATVAPVGRTPDGLPVGLQIVGPYLEDRTPIDLARRLAELIGGFEPPPGF